MQIADYSTVRVPGSGEVKEREHDLTFGGLVKTEVVRTDALERTRSNRTDPVVAKI